MVVKYVAFAGRSSGASGSSMSLNSGPTPAFGLVCASSTRTCPKKVMQTDSGSGGADSFAVELKPGFTRSHQ